MSMGFVNIAGQSFKVNMRPQFGRFGLVLCNFSEQEKVHRIHVPGGPHVDIDIPAQAFFQQARVGQNIPFTLPEAGDFGSIEMLTGYPAVDLGDGVRRIAALSVRMDRRQNATAFALEGLTTAPLDPTTDRSRRP
jgi:hypothetical protein